MLSYINKDLFKLPTNIKNKTKYIVSISLKMPYRESDIVTIKSNNYCNCLISYYVYNNNNRLISFNEHTYSIYENLQNGVYYFIISFISGAKPIKQKIKVIIDNSNVIGYIQVSPYLFKLKFHENLEECITRTHTYKLGYLTTIINSSGESVEDIRIASNTDLAQTNFSTLYSDILLKFRQVDIYKNNQEFIITEGKAYYNIMYTGYANGPWYAPSYDRTQYKNFLAIQDEFNKDIYTWRTLKANYEFAESLDNRYRIYYDIIGIDNEIQNLNYTSHYYVYTNNISAQTTFNTYCEDQAVGVGGYADVTNGPFSSYKFLSRYTTIPYALYKRFGNSDSGWNEYIKISVHNTSGKSGLLTNERKYDIARYIKTTPSEDYEKDTKEFLKKTPALNRIYNSNIFLSHITSTLGLSDNSSIPQYKDSISKGEDFIEGIFALRRPIISYVYDQNTSTNIPEYDQFTTTQFTESEIEQILLSKDYIEVRIT